MLEKSGQSRLDLTTSSKINLGTEMSTAYGLRTESYGLKGQGEQPTIDFWEKILLDSTGDIGTDLPVNVLDNTELAEFIKLYRDEIFYLATKEEPLASSVVLSEAFKARIITKGQPLTQYALAPIQKKLHSTLKKIKQFQYIGKPINDDEMIEFLENNLGTNQKWCSGDYKASTNYLRSWLSEVIWNEIISIWTENNIWEHHTGELLEREFTTEWFSELRYLGLGALTKYIIDGQRQMNGQLMGSIISFPVLCIANAVLCGMALNCDRLEHFPNRKPLRIFKMPLRINGDDCLLPLTKFGYKSWEMITAEGGLQTSVGKTYFSRDYVTLNSTLYVRTDQGWIRTRGVNFGILNGVTRSSNKNNEVGLDGKKVSEKKETVNFGRFGVLLRQLKNSCPDYLWRTVKSEFIKTHLGILRECKLSWFLPEWAGGLGFPIDDESEVSETDLHVATIVKKNINEFNFPSLSSLKEWNLHQLVRENLQVKEIPYDYLRVGSNILPLKDLYDEAYGWLVFDSFMSKKLDQLKNMDDVHNGYNVAYKRCVRLRHKAEKRIFKEQYDLMEISELQSEKKDFYIPIITKGLDYSFMGVEWTEAG